jgi:hypothetical protein
MNEFKVVGGLVELAAALKFLVICDHAWGWGLFARTSTLALWAAVALVLVAYLAGRLRCAGDEPVRELGIARLLLATAFLALALWLASGLFGADLGLLEGFFPE